MTCTHQRARSLQMIRSSNERPVDVRRTRSHSRVVADREKLDGQITMQQPKDGLRAAKTAQPVHAQVDQFDTVRQPVQHQIPRRLGQHHLDRRAPRPATEHSD
jgi:hypothetical protein